MSRDLPDLLAACGLYCGACYHYRASFLDAERLRREAGLRGREPEGFTCRGCRSGKLYVHKGCSECGIRSCVDRQGVPHCGLCASFPCARIEAFRDDGRPHHRDVVKQLEELRGKGAGRWLAEQEARWRCSCGEGFGWYEETCARCGRPLESYGADPALKPDSK